MVPVRLWRRTGPTWSSLLWNLVSKQSPVMLSIQFLLSLKPHRPQALSVPPFRCPWHSCLEKANKHRKSQAYAFLSRPVPFSPSRLICVSFLEPDVPTRPQTLNNRTLASQIAFLLLDNAPPHHSPLPLAIEMKSHKPTPAKEARRFPQWTFVCTLVRAVKPMSCFSPLHCCHVSLP